MGERPKGPIDRSWTPPSAWQQALLRDIIARLNQHNDEDTLPRSPRGLFYDLRPNGMGNGLTYVKQPQMWCVRGEHVIEGEGRCQAHRGPSRRVDETHISPKHVQETLVLARRAGLVRENWIEDTRAPTPDVPYYSDSYAEDLVDALVDEIRHPNITWSPQNGQDVYLEVLVEAAGLIGRTARVCRPYGVPVYSGGGFEGQRDPLKRQLVRVTAVVHDRPGFAVGRGALGHHQPVIVVVGDPQHHRRHLPLGRAGGERPLALEPIEPAARVDRHAVGTADAGGAAEQAGRLDQHLQVDVLAVLRGPGDVGVADLVHQGIDQILRIAVGVVGDVRCWCPGVLDPVLADEPGTAGQHQRLLHVLGADVRLVHAAARPAVRLAAALALDHVLAADAPHLRLLDVG